MTPDHVVVIAAFLAALFVLVVSSSQPMHVRVLQAALVGLLTVVLGKVPDVIDEKPVVVQPKPVIIRPNTIQI